MLGGDGRLERARVGWHNFERKDKPAFARWRAREFGVLLSTAQEVETHIRDCQTLVHGDSPGSHITRARFV